LLDSIGTTLLVNASSYFEEIKSVEDEWGNEVLFEPLLIDLIFNDILLFLLLLWVIDYVIFTKKIRVGNASN
jgi:hypothetical protein